MSEALGLISGVATGTASANNLTTTSTVIAGLSILALSSNSGTIYIGPAGVTSADGYPLAAGESVEFDVVDAKNVYIVGLNQVVRYLGLRP